MGKGNLYTLLLEEKLTDDLLRLEPNPPSLIFKGATFLVLGFLISGTRGLGLGFFRALGPKRQATTAPSLSIT